MSIEVVVVEYGSKEYEAAVRLRDAVLRAPLGRTLGVDDLQRDHEDLHLIARDGAVVVGCTIVRDLDQDVKMRQVAVAESHRGRGVGKKLVAAAEDLARAKQARGLVLNARATAVEFYLSLGYERRGEPFLEVGIPHVEMYKRLR